MKLPENVPEPGFYYHYKHDPKGPINNYAYEFLSIGFHTEFHNADDTHFVEAYFVNYRPLYEDAVVFQASKKLGVPCVDNRPLSMWMEMVLKEGKQVPRFSKITDTHIISALREICAKMYP